jgi:hypothetical protein
MRRLGPAGLRGTPAKGEYGSLRLRNTPAVPGDFAFRETELCRFLADGSHVHHALHRGQLESRRLGDPSFDALAGSILNMFTFNGPAAPPLFLDPQTGTVLPQQQ